MVAETDTTASGSASLVYSTFLGTDNSYAQGIALDSTGKVYITGVAWNPGFPVTSNAYQSTYNSSLGCNFLSEIDPTQSGSSGLVYSTAFCGVEAPASGAPEFDATVAFNVAVGPDNHAYIVGNAANPDFPVTTSATNSITGKAFVAEFDTKQSGSGSLVYSTLVGGSGGEGVNNNGFGLAVDPGGNVYVTGVTASSDFPVTADAVQSSLGSGGTNFFLVVLSPDGNSILYGTYLGGTGSASEIIWYFNDLAIDSNYGIYFVGSTASPDFQTTSGAFQTSPGGSEDGFVAKLTPFAAPVIESLSITIGAPDAPVTITGTSFGAATGSVYFGSAPASVTSWGAGSIVVSVPAGASTGNVTVTTAAGTSNGVNFTVVAPPSISASVSPAPNGSGWDNLNTTVTFTCTAGGLAIASCPNPQTVSTEGSGQIISGIVTDINGGTASTSVTVNLDKTPPSLTVSSPSDGYSTSSSSVTVSGSLSDSLSGVSGVTCNGTVTTLSSGSFSCNISLTVGVNLIVVRGTDIAGNVAASILHVTETGTLPTPTSMQVTPNNSNLVVGGTQQFTAVDDQGRPRTDATWSVSNSSIGTIDSAASPTFTAVATGDATLTATIGSLSASVTVSVLSGTSLSDGTPYWSIQPPSGFTPQNFVQAIPIYGGPDMYSFDQNFNTGGGLLSAITSDGEALWSKATTLQPAVPDGAGGIVMWGDSNANLYDLDSQTGTVVWRYTSPNIIYATPGNVAVRQDGSIVAVESEPMAVHPLTGNRYTPQTFLDVIDGTTGQLKLQVPLQKGVGTYNELLAGCVPSNFTVSSAGTISGLSIGPDSSIYVQYVVDNLSHTATADCTGSPITVNEQDNSTLVLLTLSPDGSTSSQTVKSDTASFTQSGSQSGGYGGYLVVNTTTEFSASGLFLQPAVVIPDGEGGVLASWNEYNNCTDPTVSVPTHVSDVSPGSNATYELSTIGVVQQMVLGDNGTGIAYASDLNQIVAFSTSDGSLAWTYTAPSSDYITLLASVSGGGLTAKLTDSSNTDTVLRIDPSGTAATDAWSASDLNYDLAATWVGRTASGTLANFAAALINWSSGIWSAPNQQATNAATLTVQLRVATIQNDAGVDVAGSSFISSVVTPAVSSNQLLIQ